MSANLPRVLRYTTTEGLLAMNHWACREGMNRQMDIADEPLLHPDGYHLCTLQLTHHHRAGVSVPSHWRTMWMVALQDGSPTDDNHAISDVVLIDISFELFNKWVIEEKTTTLMMRVARSRVAPFAGSTPPERTDPL